MGWGLAGGPDLLQLCRGWLPLHYVTWRDDLEYVGVVNFLTADADRVRLQALEQGGELGPCRCRASGRERALRRRLLAAQAQEHARLDCLVPGVAFPDEAGNAAAASPDDRV